MKKAAFFDRDGTINVDTGYLHKAEDLQFIQGIPELIKRCNDNDYLVIVITNQSGIARGMYSVRDMNKLHDKMNERLRNEFNAHIDAFYFCPHLPSISGKCECRKPKPGMFLKAIKDFDIDVCQSISFGDSQRDQQASMDAGIKKFYFVTEEGLKMDQEKIWFET